MPTGLAVLGSVRANLRNVTMAHNTFGVTMGSVGNIVNIENLMVSFASTGLRAGIGQTMRVANSVVTQNATGINANTGADDLDVEQQRHRQYDRQEPSASRSRNSEPTLCFAHDLFRNTLRDHAPAARERSMSRTPTGLICGTAVALILSAVPANAQATPHLRLGRGQ